MTSDPPWAEPAQRHHHLGRGNPSPARCKQSANGFQFTYFPYGRRAFSSSPFCTDLSGSGGFHRCPPSPSSGLTSVRLPPSADVRGLQTTACTASHQNKVGERCTPLASRRGEMSLFLTLWTSGAGPFSVLAYPAHLSAVEQHPWLLPTRCQRHPHPRLCQPARSPDIVTCALGDKTHSRWRTTALGTLVQVQRVPRTEGRAHWPGGYLLALRLTSWVTRSLRLRFHVCKIDRIGSTSRGY